MSRLNENYEILFISDHELKSGTPFQTESLSAVMDATTRISPTGKVYVDPSILKCTQ